MNNIFTPEQIAVMKSTLSTLSTLKHGSLDDADKKSLQDSMEDNINAMDRLNISWRLQNSLFYIAEEMDVRSFYLSTMLDKATTRCYGIVNLTVNQG